MGLVARILIETAVIVMAVTIVGVIIGRIVHGKLK